jgi:hypothetical protein
MTTTKQAGMTQNSIGNRVFWIYNLDTKGQGPLTINLCYRITIGPGFGSCMSPLGPNTLFGGLVLIERNPVIMKFANTWLIMNVGGGPTDDSPQSR